MASDPRTRGLIDRLVINDIGPEVPQGAIDRIREYASEPQFFPSLAEARRYFEKVYASFGYLSNEEWDLLVIHSLVGVYCQPAESAADVVSCVQCPRPGQPTAAADGRHARSLARTGPHAQVRTYPCTQARAQARPHARAQACTGKAHTGALPSL